MKKIFCLLLCFIIIFTTACSKTESTDNTTEPAGEIIVPVESDSVSNTTTQVYTEQSSITETEESTRKKPENTTTTKQNVARPSVSQKVTTTAPKDKPGEPSVSVPSLTCTHKNTVVTGRLEATAENQGYTGDTYCADCGKFLSKGQQIEYIESNVQEGLVKYPCPDGSFITVPVGTNVFDYTMSNAGKTASHDFYELENEVFKLFNEERSNSGVPTVTNNENAYYYVKKRAVETQYLFSHTRPDGTNFSGVYEEEGIILCAMAENLVGHMVVQEGEDVAQRIFNAIMSSPAHKQTALNAQYNQMTIAITYDNGQYYFCQHMYDNTVH